jgi:spore maturation protein CgeB
VQEYATFYSLEGLLKLLFIGESWLGSSARSLKESLLRIVDSNIDAIDELNEDLYVPRVSALWLRAINRLLAPAYRHELAQAAIAKCHHISPDVLLVYKGNYVSRDLIRTVNAMDILTVNVFPDNSPHAHGKHVRQAIGEYGLVISTKPYHHDLWHSTYGYNNRCAFVPHGYDATVHLRSTPPTTFQYDVGLIAAWRPEYHNLMLQVATLLAPDQLRIAIAGPGWTDKASEFPDGWVFPGEVLGAGYARWIQGCKIMIAPVTRRVVIDGQPQPGDEDTTRTYEFAAAQCFFIHRRTHYIHSVYEESTEVPLFSDAEELVRLIRHFLPEDELRNKMAAAAYARAVPAYSIDSRAQQILTHIRTQLGV